MVMVRYFLIFSEVDEEVGLRPRTILPQAVASANDGNYLK